MTTERANFSTYMFEPTNMCNLDCPLCPTGNLSSKRNKGVMDPELFEHVLDTEQINDKKIMLWGWGEPLLHPDLSKIVATAKARNNCIEIQTNGTAQTERYKQLLNEGLDILTFSLDGLKNETLHPLRGIRISPEVIQETILDLVAFRSETGAKTHINIQCLATGFNEQEIPDIQNWAHNVAKVDKFHVKTICLSDLTPGNQTHYLPKDPSLRRYLVRGGLASLPARTHGICNFIKTVRVVLWDFSIVPCCYDYDRAHPLGNMLNGIPTTEFNPQFDSNDKCMCEICPEMKVSDIFVSNR